MVQTQRKGQNPSRRTGRWQSGSQTYYSLPITLYRPAELLSPSVKKKKKTNIKKGHERNATKFMSHHCCFICHSPFTKLTAMGCFYWAFANPIMCHPVTALFCDSPSQPKTKVFPRDQNGKISFKVTNRFFFCSETFSPKFCIVSLSSSKKDAGDKTGKLDTWGGWEVVVEGFVVNLDYNLQMNLLSFPFFGLHIHFIK